MLLDTLFWTKLKFTESGLKVWLYFIAYPNADIKKIDSAIMIA